MFVRSLRLVQAAVGWCVFFRRPAACGYEDIAFQAIKAAITVHIISIFFAAKINKNQSSIGEAKIQSCYAKCGRTPLFFIFKL
jgi:hypothetical protein